MIGGVVAGGSAHTVRAGRIALEAGGNAVDAAIAAQLMAFVAEPLLTGIGGGGLAMVRMDGREELWDLFSDMPGRAHEGPLPPMQVVELDFGPARQQFLVGPASVAAPGLPQGLASLHAAHGRVPLPVLAAPAVQAARQGFEVSEAMARSFSLLWPILILSPDLRALFGSAAGPTPEGGHFEFPRLGDTIERFAAEGPDFLLRGDGAQATLRTLAGQSRLGALDLEAQETHRLAPVRARYRDAEVVVPGAPSRGGGMMLRALGHLQRGGPMPPIGTEDHVIRLAEAMRSAERERPADLAERLFEQGYLESYATGVGYTTHLGAVDAQGNALAITSSLGETAAILVPETGVILNNFLGEDDVNPPDMPRPAGHRLMTMCCPTLVLRGDEVLAMGSGGSSRIRSALLHGVVLSVDHGLDPAALVAEPRCHMESDRLRVELFGSQVGLEPALRHRFPDLVPFADPGMYFGGLHVAAVGPGGLSGGGDPRRGGAWERVTP